MHLRPCSGCERHVRADVTVCPFCDAALTSEADAPVVPAVRLGRAAQMAFGAAAVAASLSMAGCTKNPVGGDDSSNIAMPYGAPPDRTPMLDAATANSPEVDASTGLAVAVVDASAADAAHEAGKPDAGKAKPPPSATAAVTATATHNWANQAKPYGAPPAEGMDLFV